MHITATSRLDSGTTERRFTVAGSNGDVPGVLWTPAGTTNAPLVLLGHGGGGSKDAAGDRDPGFMGLKRHHAREVRHLAAGQFVLRMGGEARIEDAPHRRMGLEVAGHGEGGLLVGPHAHRQRRNFESI